MEQLSTTFQEMNLSAPILKGLEEMGFEEASPIQSKTIPLILAGNDIIGQAQTGTGKTAAFGIPLIEMLDHRSKKVQGMVLAPTRELAIQVAEEITKIGRFAGVKVVPIYGGQSYDRQIRALEHGAQLIIGTPGRVMDHLRRGTLKLDAVKMLVLDEADEMLDMGFIEDVEVILQSVPQERQTLLFSATVPAPIERLAKRYLKNPQRVTISPERLTVPLIDQVYYEVREHEKLEGLSRILDMESAERTIIFCRTKKRVDELTEGLQARGFTAEAIHGDLNQVQRNRVLKHFKEGGSEVLVATDVAARGLDIEHVTHVVNYDLPQDTESYVHRIGRTGRAGHSGTAITLTTPKEFRQLRQLERVLHVHMTRRNLPTPEDVAEKQRDALKQRLAEEVERGVLPQYHDIVMDLAQSYDSLDIAAAALRLMLDKSRDAQESGDFDNTGAEPG
ncbi:MAG: DEAD/DEAH box helicase, partial [Firmicutes bacterium]|nr:DEAD/DEAH box helicase [Bacillota bacterium]